MPSRRLLIAGVLFLGASTSAARASFAQGTQQHSPQTSPPPAAQPAPNAPAQDQGSAVPRGASGASIVPAPSASDAPPPPPAAPQVTPPVMLKDEGAQYPASALKDGITQPVTVVLVLEIDPQGAVRNATVETPIGHGFDEAAIEAAKKLQFE
ncbi:MAG TPA: TonB family protein, partial [Polyangiaceae bacterium]|nr:TonB family protein [Polyangiaceae bacterium]